MGNLCFCPIFVMNLKTTLKNKDLLRKKEGGYMLQKPVFLREREEEVGRERQWEMLLNHSGNLKLHD